MERKFLIHLAALILLMGNVAISGDHLTKRYSIGVQARYDPIRDRVAAAMVWCSPSRSKDTGLCSVAGEDFYGRRKSLPPG